MSLNRYSYNPDNNKPKEVYLQAAGKQLEANARHVLIAWPNGHFEYGGKTQAVRQTIQLTQNMEGYHYNPVPVAELYGEAAMRNNTAFPLATQTRAERDRILELARNIPFLQKSTVNGCRVWTLDLLVAMLKEDMISHDTFDYVDEEVPLFDGRLRRPSLVFSM